MAERDSRTLELLLEVGRLMSSKLEVGELLTTVMELAAKVVDAESASLLLLDERTEELYFDVALGLGPEAEKVRLPLGQGIAGAVAKSRAPEIINDARADARWSPAMDEQSGFTTRSILAVPIMLKGKLVGVIEAINKRQGPFTTDDLAAFEAFAAQAGIAIENARLFTSLKDERFKLATVFTQMADAAVLTDASGRVLLANTAGGRLLGAELSDMRACLKGMAVTPSLEDLLEAREPASAFAAVRREPTTLIIEGMVTRAPLADRDARLFVFRDATEARRQEALKRGFLSLISHKLKTPLASVTGFSEILLADDDADADPMRRKALKTIHEQGLKVADLVDKLLRYSTLESPDAKANCDTVVLDEAVAEALKALRERVVARGARVDARASGLTAYCDRVMVVEVLKNLIENAIKFSPRPEPPIAIRAEAEGDWVALSVADAGTGIPPEDRERVFSRFHQVEADFTGQQEGMGLGLAYTRKVAELHGGRVTLRSKLGEGTTVTVTFPRRAPKT